MTEGRPRVRMTLAEAEIDHAAEIERRLWLSGRGEHLQGAYIHLEADGRDIEVVTVAGESARTVILRGARPGSIEVSGEGEVTAIRRGSGEGDALRTGPGWGEAIREGSGDGWGVRMGDGNGTATRSGSGEGSAEMHGGRGNAIREGSGAGDAWRTGVGTGGLSGGPVRRGTGAGGERTALDRVFGAALAREEADRAEYAAVAAAWQRRVGTLGPDASWAGIPGLEDLAERLEALRGSEALRPMERLALGSALGKYRTDVEAGVVRQVPRFVAGERVRTEADEARERVERNAWLEGRGDPETSAVRRVRRRGMSM